MATAARTAPANAAQTLRDSVCGTGRDAIAVYIQIYDERTRAVADDIAANLRSAQILVPRIENVKTTADGRGTPVPIAWKVPTLLVHRPVQDKQCAASVAASLRGIELRYYRGTPTQVRDLPASFNSSRHVLELWLPVAAPETGA